MNNQAMPVKESDVWVITQPKCGTTWTQEMVRNITNIAKILQNILSQQVWQIANNVDIEGGKVLLGTRFPFLEFDTLLTKDFGEGKTVRMTQH